MKRNTKDLIIFCAYLFGVVFGGLFLWIFFTAYLQGGVTHVYINKFNEAWWEAILFPSAYLVSLVGLYLSYKNMKEEIVET